LLKFFFPEYPSVGRGFGLFLPGVAVPEFHSGMPASPSSESRDATTAAAM